MKKLFAIKYVLRTWLLISLTVSALVFIYAIAALPSAQSLLENDMQVPMRIYTKSGDLIAEYGAKHRLPLASDDIPQQMKQAVIAAEAIVFISIMASTLSV